MTTEEHVPVPAQLDALERGAAFASLPGWRAIAVDGSDAWTWLHDLVTADVAGLRDGQSRRSLPLTPTGRIRADVHVARSATDSCCSRTPRKRRSTNCSAPTCCRRTWRSPTGATSWSWWPSGRGAVEDGDDAGRALVLSPRCSAPAATCCSRGRPLRTRQDQLVAAGAVEVGLGPRGLADPPRSPRMGADFGATRSRRWRSRVHDRLHEGMLLGQESVAKVRNLGHPPRVLRAVRSGAPLRAGRVLADGHPVGEITSAATDDRGTAGIARVRWEAASLALSTEAALPTVER